MLIELLGEVEIRLNETVLDLGPPQRRAVLAALAVDVGRPVPVHTLVDRVWDEAPAAALAGLRAHLSRLRGLLRQAGDADLARTRAGYVLQVAPDSVDLHRFRRLAGSANDGTRPEADRIRLLRTALDIWRGAPLAGLSGMWPDLMREAWGRQRVDVAATWALACLRLGRTEGVIGTLRDLAVEYPLTERVVAVLMRALAACGRGTEALEHYASISERLAGELGVQPGRELREIRDAVQHGRSALPSRERDLARTAPAQLPGDIPSFTGRSNELAALDALLPGETPEGPVVVVAVTGTAGVGKTGLAVRWAHRAGHRFPDGQLYVNLRGYDPQRPMEPNDALGGFLVALGVAENDLPTTVEHRASRFRTEVAARRLLILLDNARSVEQVRPLLPGTGSCMVLVTSRDILAGLIVLHGAQRIELDALPPEGAFALLRELIGPRVDAERPATATLAEQCDRLPLAIRVAADMVSRRAEPLASIVAELADRQRRVDALDNGGDPRSAVRSVFSWSYQSLPSATARMFRLLSLHPGSDFDAHSAAALAGTDFDRARRLLSELMNANLTQPVRADRWTMHDLLRCYATELASAAGAARLEAEERLFDYYLASAAAAMDAWRPAERHRRPLVEPVDTPCPSFTDPAAALAWLGAERGAFVSLCRLGGEVGRSRHTSQLAAIVARYLELSGLYQTADVIHTLALAADRRTGDREAEARTLTNLAAIAFHQGAPARAADRLHAALRIYRESPDHAGEARVRNILGLVSERMGRFEEAIDHFQAALSLFRDIGDGDGEARIGNNLGVVYERLGQFERAAELLRRSLDVCRERGDSSIKPDLLDTLGVVCERQGRYEEAARHLTAAIALFVEQANRTGEAYAMNNLGVVHRRRRRVDRAMDLHERALQAFREIGDRCGEAEALNSLGETSFASGDCRGAGTHHSAALVVASETGDRTELARSHAGLARAHHALGDTAAARRHRAAALDLYACLGVPAGDLHSELGSLGT